MQDKIKWPTKVFAVSRMSELGLIFVPEDRLRRGDLAVEYILNGDPFSVDLKVVRNELPAREGEGN